MNYRQKAKSVAIEHEIPFICRRCGSVKNIDIHHIDGNGKNNNVSNLMMLCRGCHQLEHGNRVTFTCEYCGALVERAPSQIRGKHRFCSFKCRTKWYWENERESMKGGLIGKVKVNCENCGKPIEKWPSRIKKNKHHYCSRSCCYEWRRKQSATK